MNAQVKHLLKRISSKFGYEIQRSVPCKASSISPWNTDKNFLGIFEKVKTHTLVDRMRCFMIYQYAKQMTRLSGSVAEVGVYKGGTARLLAEIFKSTGKTIHLFDTFSGMPKSHPTKDKHIAGDFKDTSLEDVLNYLSNYKNIQVYPGLFPETAQPISHLTFCLVHIDADIYESIKHCCDFFYPRVQRGGIIIFDDYGFLSCPGAKVAVDEYFSDKIERPCYLPTGQCIISRL